MKGTSRGGGRQSEGMKRISAYPAPAVYHGDLGSLVRTAFQPVGRYLHDFAITKAEKSVCQEAMRGRSLSFDGLETLCRIAARSDRPFIVEEAVRAVVIVLHTNPPVICPLEASKQEQESNGLLDLDQLDAHREKTPVRWGRVADTGKMQMHRTRVLVDSASRVALRGD